MIFYLVKNQLVGTQAEAKAIARNYVSHEIPTDKAGLMAYVNDLLSRSGTPEPEPVDVPEREPDPPYGGGGASFEPPTTITRNQVEDWIFDQATPAQIENMFAALGTRFHEMRKASRELPD